MRSFFHDDQTLWKQRVVEKLLKKGLPEEKIVSSTSFLNELVSRPTWISKDRESNKVGALYEKALSPTLCHRPAYAM